ncbi:BRF1-domain-containing protein [Macrolepiota fuliginosa MF-IS2]|uniref:B-related factor 1 n=1 Tax=Macrolepiota fuliginosa MF-IS2 TaxID=1400762 RepID=A0A9P5XDL7_9AGAR|nr:BRF1-domain-containing protein [Macrolepiota fuliginosa MF-IS2]
MAVCSDCGGTVIEYDHAAGNGFCVTCGTVVEENTIVNEIAFGESANGAAIVQGSFVAQGATHARMGGPYGNRSSSDSREQTIENATKKIQNIANVLRLSEVVVLAARRMYTLAVEHKFTKGRKSLNVVAVCLYVACRQKETRNYMLIDFSDLLQVNVFELGHTYLQLVQTLNLRLPLVDPSHYISRFAALLEFGDETHKVATDAVRLVQRFDRDWMTKGRRPAGICGAALLLAARMNNFRRSVEEIVQVVKIADTTLKKRLDEFKATPSGSLTLADFRSVWLDEEMDPPAFTKGREREEAEKRAAEAVVNGTSFEDIQVKEKAKKRKGKRKRGDGSDEDETPEASTDIPIEDHPRMQIDPAILQQGILAGAIEPMMDTDSIPPMADNRNIDPALLHQPANASISPIDTPTLMMPPTDFVDETASTVLAEEVSTFLQNPQGAKLSEALDEAEQRRLAQITVADELMGLDEEELDRFILNEEEVRIKERVWVELNRDYLEAIAAKGDQQDSNSAAKSRKKRRTSNKPRDTTTPSGSTAAESVRNLIKKNPKYSKRINYDALKDLFVDSNTPPSFSQSLKATGEDKDEDDLYTMGDDDKSDDEGGPLVIIQEEAGTVAASQPKPSQRTSGPQPTHDEDLENVSEDEKEDYEGTWEEDMYEQEI